MSERTKGQPEPVAGEESLRCTCEWVHPVDGSMDQRHPAEIDHRCPVHGFDQPELEYVDVPALIEALEAAESELIHKCRANIAIPCNCAARIVQEALTAVRDETRDVGEGNSQAWQKVEGTRDLKACPRCQRLALEGETECSRCGLEPEDDQSWRQPPGVPYTHRVLYELCLCEETGQRATDGGFCPVHGGDACLAMYRNLGHVGFVCPECEPERINLCLDHGLAGDAEMSRQSSTPDGERDERS